MTFVQPVLALALALLCGLLSSPPPGAKRFSPPGWMSALAYAALLVAASFCAHRLGHVDDLRAVYYSIAVGGAVALLSAAFSNLSSGVSIGLAVAGACAAHLVRANNFPGVGLAFAFALALGAIFFASSPSVVYAAVVGGAVTMTDYLGKDVGDDAKWSYMGVALGIAVAASAVILLGVKKAIPKALGKFDAGLATVLGAVAGFGISKWAGTGDLWILVGIGAVAALVSHLLVPADKETTPFRTGLAAASWISLATIGFSMTKGFGMAAALAEGMVVLVVIGNPRALLTTGPALGLLLYRVLRDASPDNSRAIDIAQHYGVTGIVVGAMIPLLFSDWFQSHRPVKQVQEAVSSLLWSFILICLPVLTIVVLGAKGASGLVVGLGLSGLLISGRNRDSALPMAVMIAAGAANAVAVDWIGDALELSRSEKIHSFGWWALATAVAAVGILVMSKKKEAEAAS